jgi:hypothetical protein
MSDDDVIERWSEVRATRVRRLTSAILILGGVLTGVAGIVAGSLAALVIAITTWVVVIVGSVWLFRHRRRSR